VAGISEVEVREGIVTCQLEGEPSGLVTALQGCRMHDLLIEPARLEEAFMEYYVDDQDAAAAPPAPVDDVPTAPGARS
jgi:hypothetical protein